MKKPKERKPRPPAAHLSNTGSSSNTNSNNLQPRRKRRPGDPPRKRGRPRKHPLPEQPKDEKEEEEVPQMNDNHNDDVDNSSDENEFSDSDSFEEMGDESEQTSHRKDHYKDDVDDEDHEDDHGEGERANLIVDHDEIAARKNHRKLLKKMKQQDLAANTIQRKLSEWTKNKVVAKSVPRPTSPKPHKKSHASEPQAHSSSIKAEPKRSATGIVPAPAPEIIDWIASMSIKKQRRSMSAGLRVKVRFATKVKKRDGKIVSKHKWYGGLVTAMSSGGSKIRIKYDDSTVEVCKYPDADIIVDDEENASHQVPANAFIPPLHSDNDDDMEDSPDTALKSKIPDSTPRPADGDVPDEWKSEKKRVTSPSSSELFHNSNNPQRTRDVELTDDAATQDGTLSGDGYTQERVHHSGENPKVPDEVSGRVEKATTTQDAHMEDDASKADSDDDDDEEEVGRKDVPRIMREREISNCTASTGERALLPTDRQDNSDESSDDDGPMEVIAEGTGAEVVVAAATEETSGDEGGIAERAETEGGGDGLQEYTTRRGSISPSAKVRVHKGEHESKVDHDDGAMSDDETVDEQVEGDSQNALTDQNGPSYDDEDYDDDVAVPDVKGASIGDEKETAPRLHEKPHDNNQRPHKRKKEANSEGLISRSSTPGESSTAKPKRESPLIILSEFKKETLPRELTKPVFKVARKVESGTQGDTLKTDSPRIGSSQNSAFDKTEKPPKEKREKQGKESHQAVDEDVYSLTPNRDSGDLSSIQRSGRRAAQQANERIASRQELVIAEIISKPKKRKLMVDKLETKLPGKKRKDSEHGVDGTDGENQWVQCDLCAKWRVLPSTVDVDKLPNQWYCEMNMYDPLHNSCDATEQTPEEVAKAKRKAKRRLVRRARLEAEAAATAAASIVEAVVVEPSEKDNEKDKEVKPKITKSPAPEKHKREEKPAEEVKKPEAPALNQSDEEGKNSSGSYSDSDNKDSKKARRSRGEDGLVEVLDGVKGKARGRIRRGKDEKTKGRKGSNKGKEDNQEWVQCEKCEKWRRLPPNIAADDLPDVWYCTMNTWDPNTSTCGAAEDKADPSSHIVPGLGVQGGHKLSYRSLIFGTGKKQHRPISERMRAAESLFSSHSYTDPDTAGSHPTVMYANSSMFINRSNAARAAEERKLDKKTFLEAMSNSNLWAELRGRNRRLKEQAACKDLRQSDSGGTGITFSTLPDDAKYNVKEMIYYALGTGSMTSDELLLETQCRPWEGVPATWTGLRAICTIEMIVACLLELVKDGRIESVQSTSSHRTILEVMPRYQRVGAFSRIPVLKAEEDHLPATRLMKIAKPWKHGLSN